MGEFQTRSHFAVEAEALGVSTDCILAMTDKDGYRCVLYTLRPTDHPEEWIWYALLQPDNYRVLRVVSRRQAQKIKDFNNDVQELMRSVSDG